MKSIERAIWWKKYGWHISGTMERDGKEGCKESIGYQEQENDRETLR